MPAGVAVSAVSATLGLSLLPKVLEIVARRKNFAGDREKLTSLRKAAQNEVERLRQFAEEDIGAYHSYLEARRSTSGETKAGPELRSVIDVPLSAARSALSGLDLCASAVDMVTGTVAADLATAAILLNGAVRSLVLSAAVNLQQIPDRDAAAECRAIEEQAAGRLDYVLRRVTAAKGSSGSDS